MPRGGARPGAGRKADPNSARSKARAARDAKAALNEGFTNAAGGKALDAPKDWPFGTRPPEANKAPAPAPAPAPEEAQAANLELQPLDFLLERMRDPLEDMRIRFQAAQLAAPFVHAKPGPVGKKAAAREDAKNATANKFAVPQRQPRLAAVAGKKI